MDQLIDGSKLPPVKYYMMVTVVVIFSSGAQHRYTYDENCQKSMLAMRQIIYRETWYNRPNTKKVLNQALRQRICSSMRDSYALR